MGVGWNHAITTIIYSAFLKMQVFAKQKKDSDDRRHAPTAFSKYNYHREAKSVMSREN
jgi:hypothetical protein